MPVVTLPRLYIIIPCYNEEKVLPITAAEFKEKVEYLSSKEKISSDSKVLFVNDGSKDATWSIIEKLSAEDPVYEGLSLSRNRGHQNALLAGLMEAKDRADITISIDCDGQDDINAMDQMVDEYLGGAEIVYGVRSKRDTDTFVLKEFANFKEVNMFLRGMFPLVGFKSTCVYYERNERVAGESHYPLKKMLALALDGITSLSIKPIRIITGSGALISLLAFALIIYALISYFTGNVVSGWSSTLIATCFIGGIQLISLGIIGEYIGKIYMETKRRPRFIIEERTYAEEEK